jgi:predicted 3-demethylubiquinone-9 3-methyltransferase (glyoxalase superfamily)
MGKAGNIVPNLWFDMEAEAAVNFYTSVFKDRQLAAPVIIAKRVRKSTKWNRARCLP